MYVHYLFRYLLFKVASEIRSGGLHPDGPFKPILMHCDSGANRGSVIKWNNRDITLRIGLQCGLDKMWKKESSSCSAINETIKNQLLQNYNHYTKDLAALPNETLLSIYADRQLGN